MDHRTPIRNHEQIMLKMASNRDNWKLMKWPFLRKMMNFLYMIKFPVFKYIFINYIISNSKSEGTLQLRWPHH